MTTYQDFDPSRYIHYEDLQGKDWTLEISSVEIGEGFVRKKKKRFAIIHFKGVKKGLPVNKTIYDTIAFSNSQGADMDKWAGRIITIYPTTDERRPGQDKRCVRVREK